MPNNFKTFAYVSRSPRIHQRQHQRMNLRLNFRHLNAIQAVMWIWTTTHLLLSSLSSVSSLSSFLSLGSEEIEPGNKADPAMPSVPVIEDDSEDEDNGLYIKRLAAVRERIHYLETTRVLRPNRVHKLSQLALVLIAFKEDDPNIFSAMLSNA
ncbi:hypothetical protein B0H34DRAFT_801048 [Crassisporium funariophilum]|nr:hypothetical protein B0H34DRAFT_801048 [Crassisporium funariophilum]